MTRFDVHQHLWPEQLIAALSRRKAPPRLAGSTLELREGRFETDLPAHELEARLRLLDRDEIDVAVVCLQPTLGLEEAPELAVAYDEGILELAAASRGRIRPLAAGAARDGFAGVCVPAEGVVSGAAELDAPLVFVHPGAASPPPAGAPAWWTPVVEYAAQMQAAYAAWLAKGRREIPAVFAMMAGGAPFQAERLRSRADVTEVPPNVYFDVASYGRRAVDFTAAVLGLDRLLYGTDTPVMEARLTREAVGDAFETLAAENPARLFA